MTPPFTARLWCMTGLLKPQQRTAVNGSKTGRSKRGASTAVAPSGLWYASRSAESQIRYGEPIHRCTVARGAATGRHGCRGKGVPYSREPRRVELREQLRRPLAEIAKSKVGGEVVDEDPDRWSQSAAGR